ncbi:MAG: imidazole glycerol phosphate synthase subunit HisH [Alphaproteobacteria bacterium]|nr:imidazole glycerol phosphate synthase subunit HisH [Alphaproteobacteria bacterium]
MTVAVVDYGSGNLHSAAKAVERAAAGGERVVITADPEVVRRADRIVLPGQGAFADCKAGLAAIPGLIEAIVEAVERRGQPIFGICVGMQLMCDVGLELGSTPGFGWISGRVERIRPSDPGLKMPHMGWNQLDLRRRHPILEGIEAGAHAYFCHSFHMACDEPNDILATSDYGGPVTAAVARANRVATQFHPEKSQAIGLSLLANFLKWRP